MTHTSYREQQEFLHLSPDQQNLRIYMSSKETNGKVAEALTRIALLEPKVARHDFAFKVAALFVAVVVAAGPFVFWALDHVSSWAG